MDLLGTPQPHSYLDWEKQELGVQEPILSERRASETESWSPFDVTGPLQSGFSKKCIFYHPPCLPLKGKSLSSGFSPLYFSSHTLIYAMFSFSE